MWKANGMHHFKWGEAPKLPWKNGFQTVILKKSFPNGTLNEKLHKKAFYGGKNMLFCHKKCNKSNTYQKGSTIELNETYFFVTMHRTALLDICI